MPFDPVWVEHDPVWVEQGCHGFPATATVQKTTEEEVRVTSETGARKGTKIQRTSLIPPKALLELARHYGVGAQKYTEIDDEGNVTHDGANNWRLGYKWSLSMDALLRHTLAFVSGEDYDEETGSKHIIAAAWHALALATFMDEHPELDDRWKGQL